MTGKRFQDWNINECLGEGAYGKVYKITREEFGHTYEAALKVIDIPKSQSEVESFRNEGMTDENVTTYFLGMVEKIVEEFALMSRLKGNSNIVSYEDHLVEQKKDEFGWRIFIRMELLTPLYKYVNKNGLNEQDIIKLGIDICKSLELCKKNNIIHRDIKPENIFISSGGDFKLGDFGIARELERTSAGLSVAGSPSYMAPEVCKGYEYNSTVDIYSLGIVLYRFLNDNRLPFMPPAPKQIKFSDQDYAKAMRLSGQKMPNPVHASEELAEVVLKACEYLPSDRYQIARDMRKALEALRREESEEEVIILCSNERIENKDISSRMVSDIKEISMENSDTEDNMTMALFTKQERDICELSKRVEFEEIVKEDNNSEIDLVNKSKVYNRKEFIIKICKIGAVPFLVMLICFAFWKVFSNNGYAESNDNNPKSVAVNGDTQHAATAESVTMNNKPAETPVGHINVPDLKGMIKGDVEKRLFENKLGIKTITENYSDSIKKGQVISQEPKAGSNVTIGSLVSIVISKGEQKVLVPSVKGLSLRKAKEKLKRNHLKCKVKKKYSSSIKEGYIINQTEKAKTKVKKGKTVTIYVSLGEKPVPVTTPENNYSYSKSNNNTNKKPKKSVDDNSDGTFIVVDDNSDGTFR